MLRKPALFVLAISLGCAALAFGQAEGVAPAATAAKSPDPRLAAGMQAFNAERYGDALDAFASILADPKAASLRSDATYWSVLAYLALGDQAAAGKAIDAYLAAYPDGPRVPDLLYQRGRILYAKGSYEDALRTFSSFITAAPDHSLVPSALYWGGECLYSLGRLDDADKAFQTLMDRYPTSVKVEAARYRRELISLEFRESELLKLLTWSHEEALRAAEDFRTRERNYEVALAAYQKQLGDASRLGSTSPELKARIDELSGRLAQAQAELEAAKAALAKAQSSSGQAVELPTPAPVSSPPVAYQGDEALLAQALEAKRRALDLLSFYLDRLSPGGSK
jgi:TolA-binding protein